MSWTMKVNELMEFGRSVVNEWKRFGLALAWKWKRVLVRSVTAEKG